MPRHIYRITAFEIIGPYKLRLWFDDGAVQEVDFLLVLEGEMYGPLKNLSLFNQVRLDSESHTVVWPNDADFDPETLRNWPIYRDEMVRIAQSWAVKPSRRRVRQEQRPTVAAV